MPTNLSIDEKLIEEARKVGHHKTNKEAVSTGCNVFLAPAARANLQAG